MKRFEDAQVGDLVYHRKLGNGVVYKVNGRQDWPITVEFQKEICDDFTMEGKDYESDAEALLFYRDSSSNYLTERPVPTISASLVPVDTKIIVFDLDTPDSKRNRHYAGVLAGRLYAWDSGLTSFSSGFADLEWCAEDKVPNQVCGWDFTHLAEPLTIGTTTYPSGTKIVVG